MYFCVCVWVCVCVCVHACVCNSLRERFELTLAKDSNASSSSTSYYLTPLSPLKRCSCIMMLLSSIIIVLCLLT